MTCEIYISLVELSIYVIKWSFWVNYMLKIKIKICVKNTINGNKINVEWKQWILCILYNSMNKHSSKQYDL